MPPCVVVMNNGMVQREQEGLRVLETNAITRLLLRGLHPLYPVPLPGAHRQVEPGHGRPVHGLHADQHGHLGPPGPVRLRRGVQRLCGCAENRPVHADQSYLKELDDKEKFQQDFKVFFRGCGDTDYIALDRFEKDRELFREKGLAPEDLPCPRGKNLPRGARVGTCGACACGTSASCCSAKGNHELAFGCGVARRTPAPFAVLSENTGRLARPFR